MNTASETAAIEESRERVQRGLTTRERIAAVVSFGSFLACASALAVALPVDRSPSAGVVALLVVGYALLARIEFEVGSGSAVPTQLVFVPMLFLLPLGYVPLAVAAGYALTGALDAVAGRFNLERTPFLVSSSWYAVGPVAVLAAAGSGEATWDQWPVYLGALAAQFAVDLVNVAVRERLAFGVRLRELASPLAHTYLFDALLAPAGLLAAVAAMSEPYAFAALLPLAGLFAIVARERRARIDAGLAAERYAELAGTDALTGLLNRRGWEEQLPAFLETAEKTREPLCVMVLDLDEFKDFNDTQGHQAGDELLRRAAMAWRATVRPTDLCARIGGEEFGLAFAGCSLEQAQSLADALRHNTPQACTCSVGVAQWDGRETAPELVRRADEALYAAKRSGRNCVRVALRAVSA